jgi:hypothetical protein
VDKTRIRKNGFTGVITPGEPRKGLPFFIKVPFLPIRFGKEKRFGA